MQLSVTTPSGRTPIDSAQWDARGDTTWLEYTTGDAGTYVAGLFTKPKEFRLEAKGFNQCLAATASAFSLSGRWESRALVRQVHPQDCRSSWPSRLRVEVGLHHIRDPLSQLPAVNAGYR
ncbi:hypothetical protein [Gemmatimonas sp.]|uniref:hypothetical protein n=1 Tax=Gemmatimonas sp. TaxID=1962908 RepID=UPI00356A08C7